MLGFIMLSFILLAILIYVGFISYVILLIFYGHIIRPLASVTKKKKKREKEVFSEELLDETEETNEVRGIPSSPVMDMEDKEEEGN